mmetsp:Transcript_30930/g.84873  ORF Transcript_30930/g.84873 Transcript_30930/m.84873 type:complete len:205 (+) Transcript_30930:408-1022(+)
MPPRYAVTSAAPASHGRGSAAKRLRLRQLMPHLAQESVEEFRTDAVREFTAAGGGAGRRCRHVRRRRVGHRRVAVDRGDRVRKCRIGSDVGSIRDLCLAVPAGRRPNAKAWFVCGRSVASVRERRGCAVAVSVRGAIADKHRDDRRWRGDDRRRGPQGRRDVGRAGAVVDQLVEQLASHVVYDPCPCVKVGDVHPAAVGVRSCR